MQRLMIIAGAVAALAFPSWGYAQEGVTAYDESQLTSLYRSLLKYPQDEYIQKRIADERARVRAAIEKEIRKTADTSKEPPAPQDGQGLPSAIEQQRTVVSGLEERLKERKVNRDLLLAEQQKYYGTSQPLGEEEGEEFRLAKSHEDLLAKLAIDEERIGVLESVLSLEEQRFSKLNRDQWLAQFGHIIRILTWIGILVAVVAAERMIRSILSHRIVLQEKRYIVTKLFTTAVYTVLTVWVLTTVVAEHPGILTSLAIVGAGLAVALQDVVKDVVGWIMILQKRLFTLGDRVSVGPYTGDIVDITLLRTTMLEVHSSPEAAVQERTGRTLTMPNAAVLTYDVVNFNRTSDYVKAEMGFTLTLESDWHKAETILGEILDRVTGEYTRAARKQYDVRTRTLFVRQEPSGPEIYMDIAGDGIAVRLRFTIPIGMRRAVITQITQETLHAFAKEEHVSLAYRTSMVYNAEHPAPPLFDPRA
ncbi:mechanosensitive ion channel [Candidatus Peribacteria bacterium]|nr:mechanosensitive ion channel [Candidatus Peribacteria bacterium]